MEELRHPGQGSRFKVPKLSPFVIMVEEHIGTAKDNERLFRLTTELAWSVKIGYVFCKVAFSGINNKTTAKIYV